MRALVLSIFFLLTTFLTFSQDCKKDTVNTEKPHTVVEIMPSFPGGEGEMMKFIRDNLKYPKSGPAEQGLCTRITVRFVVLADGSITDIQLIRSCFEEFDLAVINLIKKMPKWTPGKQNGKNVPVYFTLPIHIDFK